jgi:phage shock protein E
VKTPIRSVVIMSLALGLLAACGGDTATGTLETVDAAAFADLASEPATVILDIRTLEEFDSGHIDGSVNIDFYAADFADQIGALDRDTQYVVYCRSGNRSGQAMDLFAELQFNTVYELGEGIVAWSAAGLPLTTG